MPTGEQRKLNYVREDVAQGVIVLTIGYSTGELSQHNFGSTLTDELVTTYERLVKDNAPDLKSNSCIIIFDPSVTAVLSRVPRALFSLYRTVLANNGVLRIVDYPAQYRRSLAVLGLTDLPGFKLAQTPEHAFKDILPQTS